MLGAKNARIRLQEKMWELQENGAKKGIFNTQENYSIQFLKSINDDLNMPKALAVVWDILKSTTLNDSEKYSLLLMFDSVLGLKLNQKKKKINVPKEVLSLARKRETARTKKEWDIADAFRKKIETLGFLIADSKSGFEITKKDS